MKVRRLWFIVHLRPATTSLMYRLNSIGARRPAVCWTELEYFWTVHSWIWLEVWALADGLIVPKVSSFVNQDGVADLVKGLLEIHLSHIDPMSLCKGIHHICNVWNIVRFVVVDLIGVNPCWLIIMNYILYPWNNFTQNYLFIYFSQDKQHGYGYVVPGVASWATLMYGFNITRLKNIRLLLTA